MFGDLVVSATYVTCEEKHDWFHKEARHEDRNFTCVQCEDSPVVSKEVDVDLKVSITGDFNDTSNTLQYSYYKPTRVTGIFPRYGKKDGNTPVQVWGENFRDHGLYTRCNFGSTTTNAIVFNSTYIECNSTFSDVVEKAIPFSVTLNNQQNSRDDINFWYYNWPGIMEIVPNHGPQSSETTITLKGYDFYPFKEVLDKIDNANDTFCAFVQLGKMTPAIVTNSTRATCVAPKNYVTTYSDVELTLNFIEYTNDTVKFYWYKTPDLYSVEPREGPTSGQTNVRIIGSKFPPNTGYLRCSFDGIIVNATYVSGSEVECLSPYHAKPQIVDLRISFTPDEWSSNLKYLYYNEPAVGSIYPECGPDYGYTQIKVTGKDFVDLGHNKALCVFNETIYTNATVFDDTTLYCDSPPFMDKLGYSMYNSNSEYNYYYVKISIDGGKVLTKTAQKFTYYKEAQILSTIPDSGPVNGATTVAIQVAGLTQPGLCGIYPRLSTFELQ
mmetsp:Transcript_96914/g.133461  ORF Transcript_96914/g.133461 Transcript_96914/m.133461 type:complete len:496 (+) Transcript_96914:397-1884(+)